MSCCPDFEPLLLERSSGSLDAPAAARLAAHLDACPGCQREAETLEDLVALVTLPPPRAAERAAFEGLAASIRAEQVLRAGPAPWSARRSSWLVAGAAAAAVLVVAASPLVAHRNVVASPASLASSPGVVAWQPPDPDELLEAADFDDDGSVEWGADEVVLASATAEHASPSP